MADKNINTELFKRYAPQNKLKMIEDLDTSGLQSITPATITRIVKEVGQKQYKSRDKRLHISRDRQRGNGWNSHFTAVSIYGGKLYVELYFQMDDTDTDLYVPYSEFFSRGEYRGKASETNRYGDQVVYYCTYDEPTKLRCLRSILFEYVCTKYADKLGKEETV